MKKTFATKLTSITTAAAIAVSMLPVVAYAADTTEDETSASVEESASDDFQASALPVLTTVETTPVVEVVSATADLNNATTFISYDNMNFALDNTSKTAALVAVNPQAEGAVVVPETICNADASYTVTTIGQKMFGGGSVQNPFGQTPKMVKKFRPLTR